MRLAEVFGWLPPDPAVIQAEWERMRQLHEQQSAPQSAQPWTRPDTSSYDVDANGRKVYHRPALPPHPLDVFRAPGIFTAPGYRPGG